ncbi:hypothetical protein BO82DRAFT_139030 [Aspergillus uvarum CBS 121591]|uniref:Uncharacterized protein n=1 Tax=Aspergillus uvarum CBS 121591 TaxID=1448315 RepID=A0A319C5B0_9EURO|nr:hypothetical protein BO82DRAFT_139030 [Aspergillus uvarum CBS 121591]PYH79147.1 hypothetical protein BO82DRAFT_139030 [Aspergillus uvarum CBS 121591]
MRRRKHALPSIHMHYYMYKLSRNMMLQIVGWLFCFSFLFLGHRHSGPSGGGVGCVEPACFTLPSSFLVPPSERRIFNLLRSYYTTQGIHVLSTDEVMRLSGQCYMHECAKHFHPRTIAS